MKIVFTILLITTTQLLLASEFKVIKLAGQVSLKINGKESIIKVNDLLPVGATITTSQKSFVLISTPDNNQITLGSSSILKLTSNNKDEPALISLIQGRIRALANKKIDHDLKMVIRTDTVSLGVRGTDFEMVFNPKNKITSTLTYEGQVHQINNIQEQETIDLQKLKNDLDSSLSSKINSGEFSGGYQGFRYPTEATKISPEQFEILKKNRYLVTGVNAQTITSKTSTIDLDNETDVELERNEALVPAPSNLKTQSYVDQDNDIIRPRPGGYLDLKTGIYVSPPPSAQFDSKKQVFIQDNQFGGVNSKTGEYVPPEGTELTADKGFIPTLKAQTQEVSKLLTKLNNKIKTNFLDKIKKKYTENEMLKRVQLSAETKFSFDSNVTHQLHDELLEVSNAPSGIFDAGMGIGHQIIDSRKWTVIPKGRADIKLHTNQANPKVDKHDLGNLMGGMEVHHHYKARHFPAKHFLNLEANATYKDYRDRDNFNFYNRDLSIEFGEDLVLIGRHRTQLSYDYRTYKTYQYQNRGEIHSVILKHFIPMGRRFKMSFDGIYRKKINAESASQTKIQKYGLNLYRMNFLKNTDLLLNTNFKQTTRTHQPLFKEWGANISLIKDMKNALWGELSYEYIRNQTQMSEFDFAKHIIAINLYFKI